VGGIDILRHQSEWFFFSVLAVAQRCYDSGIAGVARQVVSAKAFHCENCAIAKKLGCANETVNFTTLLVCISWRVKIVSGTAGWTSYGLRVKTAVARVGVFCGAVIIEEPCSHCGIGPVVGQGQHDAVAWTAVGAIDVGVEMTGIGWIKEFFQTFGTDRQVRRNADCGALVVLALPDGEFVQAFWLRREHIDFGDAGRGRRLRFQIPKKSFEASLGAFEMNFDSFFPV
jgi:hypothetical protein